MQYADFIDINTVKPDFAMPFNMRVVDDAIMIANDFGDFAFLTPSEFQSFVAGDIAPGDELYERLKAKSFIASEADDNELVSRYFQRKSFLHAGPTLHAFVLTERCNHGCQYCHSSIVGMSRMDTDMTVEVARRAVDFAFQTTSPWMTIEFQGGEPTANWETLQFVVEYAQEKNKIAKKELSFALVTNFSLMTDERLEFLIANRVQLCTSLDGPADLHNKTRIFHDGNSHEITLEWIHKVNARYIELGLDPILYRVEALPTITRHSLPRYREIIDHYVDQGCRAVFLRVLDPFGFAASTRRTLGYTIDEFLEFYRNSVDYIIELNKQGVEVMERLAAIMLNKMIAHNDPNYLDLRSPGGAVIGQMGYHPDGSIYSSDEGRMVAAMGDDIFRLGDTENQNYGDIIGGDVARSLILASTNDGHPRCASCVYKVYCGQQPEYNYKTQGSLFGRMVDSTWCRKHMGIFDYLSHRLKNATKEEMEIFERWTINRRQDHFVQDTE
ncbi:MAG: His-Xaa-Ser system radical SAM maturase HxsB [Myxococcales bacterium]|nr:His-Xaa-Ser system radical SAM maturase HxsB [Myxococcales bacterium]